MPLLQKSLLANAILSLVTGSVLIVSTGEVMQLIGVSEPVFFQVLGVLLVGFAMLVAAETVVQQPIPVLGILALDGLWVVGSGLVLLLNPWSVSNTGLAIIGTVGLIVLLLAILQAKGLAGIDADGNGHHLLSFEREIPAPKADSWKVIADVANYNNIAPNIDESKILSGVGEGMVRQCSHGREQWHETCTLWEEGKRYAFEVNTQRPDYPYPFAQLSGTWEVIALGERHSTIKVSFAIKYKKAIQSILLHPFLKQKMQQIGRELLENYEEKIMHMASH